MNEFIEKYKVVVRSLQGPDGREVPMLFVVLDLVSHQPGQDVRRTLPALAISPDHARELAAILRHRADEADASPGAAGPVH